MEVQLDNMYPGSLSVAVALRGAADKGLIDAAALAAPSTAYLYDWNLLPIGQNMALKFLDSYEKFPPLQAPPSFNLEQVMTQIRVQKRKIRIAGHPSD
jgi:hypothetical protein